MKISKDQGKIIIIAIFLLLLLFIIGGVWVFRHSSLDLQENWLVFFDFDGTLKLKSLSTGEEQNLASEVTSPIISQDKNLVYFAKYSGESLSIFRYSIKNNSLEEIYNKKFDSKILKVQLSEDKEDKDKLFIFITLKNPAEEGNPETDLGVFVIERLIALKIPQKSEEVIYDKVGNNASPLEFLTHFRDDYYFVQRSFEGSNFLFDYKKGIDEMINLSENYQFEFDNFKLSPDGKFIALATLISQDTEKTSSQLSFFDLENKNLFHSKLVAKEGSSRFFIYGKSGFRHIDWSDDSSFLYVSFSNFLFEALDTELDAIFPSQDYQKFLRYYYVNLDGSLKEDKKLKEKEGKLQLIDVIDKNLAIGVKKEAKSNNLVLINLKNYQPTKTIFVDVGNSLFDLQREFVGILKLTPEPEKEVPSGSVVK